MPQTKEEKAAYDKTYREKNKEEKAAYNKEWYQKNKERIAAREKAYREKNKERIAARGKEYRQSPDGIKSNTFSNWKRSGLICEDVDSLYCHYLNATNCDECGVEFGTYGDGSGTYKCMDHSHATGKFRNFLCNRCNLKRGEHNL